MKAILAGRAETARSEARDRERAQPLGVSLDELIDRRLADGASSGDGETEEELAFRIMGALFAVMPQASTAKPFLAQVRRLLPGRSAERYRALYRHALDAWVRSPDALDDRASFRRFCRISWQEPKLEHKPRQSAATRYSPAPPPCTNAHSAPIHDPTGQNQPSTSGQAGTNRTNLLTDEDISSYRHSIYVNFLVADKYNIQVP